MFYGCGYGTKGGVCRPGGTRKREVPRTRDIYFVRNDGQADELLIFMQGMQKENGEWHANSLVEKTACENSLREVSSHRGEKSAQ